jgi:hypothetical protein
MRCPGCNAVVATTVGECGRCGFAFRAKGTDQPDLAAEEPEAPGPDVFTPPGGGIPPVPDPHLDLQRSVGTVVGTFDRQKAIATKVGIVLPKKRRAREEGPTPFTGGFFTLPESTVSKDFDGAVTELRIFLARMGLVGRFTLYLQTLIVAGGLLPWTRTPGVGQASGLEDLGWLPAGLTLLASVLHAARYRRKATLRPLLAFGALLLQAGAVLSVGWALRVNLLTAEMLRPALLWGFWWTCLAAILALMGTLVAMKDIGARR